ncbi:MULTISPECIES: 3',5'-cyclic-AMP phosphodiesterase [unclassified Acinetobacter]|uniref:3',5'-cyclic-AMP phosphodiesterase n=1 Tax=unclassified Acinetobacter TaxID=196816 RepID=UPI001EDAB2BF|nr:MULTISPECIES: 3',5'-cyclic-AMP phosphodiesterase [unclassified Acinetobacter]MCG2608566.1 3',5'-cyclic-AMP phosphodiesterase [Acinetobacter sp. SM34]MDN5511491.1 3',5'-cyclic-AMP phosphodiesterase [Acinetobacter sp.]MDN5523661.1 3',5'-cyclic-AMP phosphodiesterase [Acinetobacter sp.]
MTLSNNNQDQQDWTIIQISDTHLMNQEDLEFVHMNPEHSFHAIIKQIQQHYPNTDAIIHTGDLAQVPVAETYSRYLSFMQALGIPFYQIPGNHDDLDLFPFYQNKDEAQAIHFGKWSFVLLNSAVQDRTDGWIEQEQLQQLDRLLAKLQQQFVIVACHHHPFEMQSKWIDQHILKNTENLTDILAKHSNVKAVIFGHVHQDSWHEWQHIQFFSTPSTCVQFKPLSEDFALDNEAPGFRVLHLKANGELETQIYRVLTARQQINSEISGY